MNGAEGSLLGTTLIWGYTISQIWVLVSPLLAGLLAAWITHSLNRKRDETGHQLRLDYEVETAARQIRRDKLLRAYEMLDAAEPARMEYLELDTETQLLRVQDRGRALAVIKLFGTENQCDLVDEYIDALSTRTPHGFGPLMNNLRDQLRVDYGLELTVSRYKWVDFKMNATKTQSNEEAK